MPAVRSAGKAVFGDVLGKVAEAPVFWYTRGAYDAGFYCSRLISHQWKNLGVGIWVKNIFVPMFGQRDVSGSLISFFMRVVQIIARSAAMLVWVTLVAILYIAYLALPILVFIKLLRQVAGVFVP